MHGLAAPRPDCTAGSCASASLVRACARPPHAPPHAAHTRHTRTTTAQRPPSTDGARCPRPGEPLHFGIPGAEHVMRQVVGGVDLDGFGGFIEDDLRVADPLFTAFRA